MHSHKAVPSVKIPHQSTPHFSRTFFTLPACNLQEQPCKPFICRRVKKTKHHVDDYSVENLDALIVRLVIEELAWQTEA
jgi:hypothetical protein